MSDLRKAAEMALEAWGWDWSEPRNEALRERMEALRQALAQQEEDPLVWMNKYGHVSSTQSQEYNAPLYTAPPKREWVGLTDERVDYLADKYAPPIHPSFTGDDDYWKFYQEIETELKEKNT